MAKHALPHRAGHPGQNALVADLAPPGGRVVSSTGITSVADDETIADHAAAAGVISTWAAGRPVVSIAHCQPPTAGRDNPALVPARGVWATQWQPTAPRPLT